MRASGQNGLVGKSFPQSPKHSVIATLRGRPFDKLGVFAQIEVSSSQFDDPRGERRLGSWWTTRIGGEFKLASNMTLHVRVENLLDREIITGLSSAGLRSVGQPRSFWMGMNYSF